jgi:hypothetical protein
MNPPTLLLAELPDQSRPVLENGLSEFPPRLAITEFL